MWQPHGYCVWEWILCEAVMPQERNEIPDEFKEGKCWVDGHTDENDVI